VIAHFGLESLSRGPHGAGLAALLEEGGLLGKRVNGFHVGFVLGPRINAAGRMQSADLALDLLLIRGNDADSRNRARVLAQRLSQENTRRQEQEAAILSDAKRSVDNDLEVGAHNILVVADDHWHRGVVGIVASKLVDTYCKPALVLSIEDGIAHGSARSIPAFDMLAALESCADLFVKFGGHRQAAGLTMERGKVKEFRKRINDWADARLEPDDLIPRLRVDAGLEFNDILSDVVEGIDALQPFGLGNPRPVFDAAAVEIINGPHRLKDRHLTMNVKQHGRVFRAIAWRAAERAEFLQEHRRAVRLAYSLDKNTFRGETSVELNVADVQAV
jgi:single-stranded-DNA-specific exonuclease